MAGERYSLAVRLGSLQGEVIFNRAVTGHPPNVGETLTLRLMTSSTRILERRLKVLEKETVVEYVEAYSSADGAVVNVAVTEI